jgi:hypothetical protein
MALRDTIAKVVAIANIITKNLQGDVSHYPWIAQNAFGSVSQQAPFGQPILRTAIIEQQARWRQMPNGNMVFTYAHLIFLEPFEHIDAPNRKNPIDPRDRLILPDGSTGPIVDVDGLHNPGTKSPYFCEVWLGGQIAESSR